MTDRADPCPDWVSRGKTIRQLIDELRTFEDLDLEVRISFDAGETHLPVSLVGRIEGKCVLMYAGEQALEPYRRG